MPEAPSPDEGGDPACWAHLFEDDDRDDPPVVADDAAPGVDSDDD